MVTPPVRPTNVGTTPWCHRLPPFQPVVKQVMAGPVATKKAKACAALRRALNGEARTRDEAMVVCGG